MMIGQEGVGCDAGAWGTRYKGGTMRATMSINESVDMVRHVRSVPSMVRRTEEVAWRHQRLKGGTGTERIQVVTLNLALNAFTIWGVADEG